jgi:hypothetical protein
MSLKESTGVVTMTFIKIKKIIQRKRTIKITKTKVWEEATHLDSHHRDMEAKETEWSSQMIFLRRISIKL